MGLTLLNCDQATFVAAAMPQFGGFALGQSDPLSANQFASARPDRDVAFFVANRDGQTAGRIMVHAARPGQDGGVAACFAGFECGDDRVVAKVLLDIAADWTRARGLTQLIGVVLPSDQPELGVKASVHAPYLAGFLVENGFATLRDLNSYWFDPTELHLIGHGLTATILQTDPRYNFASQAAAQLSFRLAEAEVILNAAARHVFPFAGLISLSGRRRIDPDLCVVLHHQNKPVACCLCLPDLQFDQTGRRPTQGLLQKLTGFRRVRPQAAVLLAGLLPEYRHLEPAAQMIDRVLPALRARGYICVTIPNTADLQGFDVTQPGVRPLQQTTLFSRWVRAGA